jgi:single-stranded DNA-binding protein
MYQNKVSLIGSLGGDAEVRNANNRSFTTFSLATKPSRVSISCRISIK